MSGPLRSSLPFLIFPLLHFLLFPHASATITTDCTGVRVIKNCQVANCHNGGDPYWRGFCVRFEKVGGGLDFPASGASISFAAANCQATIVEETNVFVIKGNFSDCSDSESVHSFHNHSFTATVNVRRSADLPIYTSRCHSFTLTCAVQLKTEGQLSVQPELTRCNLNCGQNGQCTYIRNEQNGLLIEVVQTCECDDGYDGANCQNDLCHSNQCLNGGTCTRLPGNFECTCASGFEGLRCATSVACSSSPCVYGTCANVANGFECTCTSQYQGTTCNLLKSVSQTNNISCSSVSNGNQNNRGYVSCGSDSTCCSIQLGSGGRRKRNVNQAQQPNGIRIQGFLDTVGRVPVFDELVKSIEMNCNGFITFDNPNIDSAVKIKNVPKRAQLVAPFFLDCDKSKAVATCNGQKSQLKIFTFNANTISQIQPNLDERFGNKFKVQNAFVFSWENLVSPSDSNRQNPDKCVSFEMILASNGSHSQSSFLYLDVPDTNINSGYVLERKRNTFNIPRTNIVLNECTGRFCSIGLLTKPLFDTETPSSASLVAHWVQIQGKLDVKKMESVFNFSKCPCGLDFIERNNRIQLDLDRWGAAFTSDKLARNVRELSLKTEFEVKTYQEIAIDPSQEGPFEFIRCRKFCLYRCNGNSKFCNVVKRKEIRQCGLECNTDVGDLDRIIFDFCKRKSPEWIDNFRRNRPCDENCQKNPPPFSMSFGDPHIITMDELEYTFNGLGEYVLVKLNDVNKAGSGCQIQARTEQATDVNGTSVSATVFSAMLLTCNDSSSIEVIVNKNISGFDISFCQTPNRVNCSKIEAFHLYNNHIEENAGNNYKIERVGLKTDTDKAIINYGSRATKPKKLFTLEVEYNEIQKAIVPRVRLGDSSYTDIVGLLGNNDGDKTNDLRARDGTILDINNLTDQIIYEKFGETWRVPASESYWPRDEGSVREDFHDTNFTPNFFETIPWEPGELESVNATCKNERACIFDYGLTKNAKFAEATGVTNENQKNQREQEADNPPEFISPLSTEKQNIEIGKEKEIKLSATDANGDVVEVDLVSLPENMTGTVDFNKLSNTLRWTPSSPSFEGVLEFKAVANGKTVILELPLVFCDCENGNCDYSSITKDATKEINYAKCDCFKQWTGSSCTEDVNGCDSANSNCVCRDVIAADSRKFEQNNQLDILFNCSSCISGYGLQQNPDTINVNGIPLFTICEDINECNDNKACDLTKSKCENSDGDYKCVCLNGFQQGNSDKICNDIDECQSRVTNDCEQVCTNTEGSFKCECFNGFTLQADNKTCKGLSCADAGCEFSCEKSNGLLNCTCPTGMTLSNDGKTCQDINECETIQACDLSNSICINEISLVNDSSKDYSCKCFPGFKTDPKNIKKCIGCSDRTFGENCNQECKCILRGECNSTIGCICPPGYKQTSTCTEDINECLEGACKNVENSRCLNTEGSFRCECNQGYELNNEICVDLDECEDSPCASSATCTNTVGSFKCECPFGSRGDGFSCATIEINECLSNTDDCDANAVCSDTLSAFDCTCKTGFTGDGKLCADINECLVSALCHKDAVCKNNAGSYSCTCNPGYEGDGITSCDDINECFTNSTICGVNAHCTNKPGTFSCACESGFEFGGGSFCQDVNECDQNVCDPKANCTNTEGSFTCTCNTGYTGSGKGEKGCANINECDLNPCKNTENCTDTEGSFICSCLSGYETKNGVCTDIDECTVKPDICGNSTCKNTDGSFFCQDVSCLDGFEKKQGEAVCQNINECEKNLDNCTKIGGVCTDNVGSFSCRCQNGYQGNGYVCIDVDECKIKNNCHPSASCTNTEGTYTCECLPGFTGNGKLCSEIDECLSKPCGQNALCKDLVNDYQCNCETGYEGNGLNRSALICRDINECNIQSLSKCDQGRGLCTNSQGSFNCSCKTGFTGDGKVGSCQNIDECAINNGGCDAKATCKDNDGSFVCVCPSGYRLVGKLTCENIDECAENIYGRCSNTAQCVDTDGDYNCTCVKGFVPVIENGITDCKDANQCFDSTHSCPAGSTCVNNEIGYTCSAPDFVCDYVTFTNVLECSCKQGYTELTKLPNFSCKDLDECTESNDCPENANCTNSKGSYECNCKSGFKPEPFKVDRKFNFFGCHQDACFDKPCESTKRICSRSSIAPYFTCACPAGFEFVSGNCQDINECDKKTDGCTADYTCENVVGGYVCNSANATCPFGNTVERPNGVFQCKCSPGFKKIVGTVDDINTFACNDDDECLRNDACPANAACLNLVGSHSCSCEAGFSPPTKKENNVFASGCNIDACNPNPCKNGGICIRKFAAPLFQCGCIGVWAGPLCTRSRLVLDDETCNPSGSLMSSSPDFRDPERNCLGRCCIAEGEAIDRLRVARIANTLQVLPAWHSVACIIEMHRVGFISLDLSPTKRDTIRKIDEKTKFKSGAAALYVFWGNHKMTNNSRMKLRQFQRNPARPQDDEASWNQTHAVFADHLAELSSDQSAWLLIAAQWEKLQPSGDVNCNDSYTFEALILTDGRRTLIAYNFVGVDVNDACATFDGVLQRIEIGYNVENGDNSMLRISESNTLLAYHLSKEKLRGGGMFEGLAIFDAYASSQVSDELAILEWAREQRSSNGDISSCKNSALDLALPRCPCNVDVNNGKIVRNTKTLKFKPFGVNGIRSKKDSSYSYFNSAGQQVTLLCQRLCEYTNSGSLAGIQKMNMISCGDYPKSYPYIRDIDIYELCKSQKQLCYSKKIFTDCRPNYNQNCTLKPNPPSEAAGDPHFETFDRKKYSFNGLGKYILVELDSKDGNQSCIAYAQTDQAINAVTGLKTPATVFSGFSAKCKDTPRFRILMITGGMTVELCEGPPAQETCNPLKGFDTKAKYEEENDAANFVFTKESNTHVTVKLGVDFDLTLTVIYNAKGFLLPSIRVDASYTGRVKGLLGNMDGDATNDFIPRGKTTWLPTNSSESVIYNDFGKTYEVPDILEFKARQIDPNFQPAFSDALDWTGHPVGLAAAQATCGTNQACLFDVFQTADATFGQATKSAQEALARTREIEDNTPPRITSPSISDWQVKTGEVLTFTFTAETTNKYPVTLGATGLPTGATFNRTTGNLNWLAIFDASFNGEITLLAFTNEGDPTKEKKTEMVITIVVCNCQNSGTCDFNNIRVNTTTGASIAGCICPNIWEGDLCERDLNGCFSNPCKSDGTGCEDVPATVDVGVHHNCTECDADSSLKKTKVTDLFMCLEDRACPAGKWGVTCQNDCKCQHGICNSTIGCVCPKGYQGTFCELDIDECKLGTSSCKANSQCVNTPGSYLCPCLNGFILNTVNQCVDLNECTKYRPCDINANCSNTAGSYSCKCNDGFFGDGTKCQTMSINECLLSPVCVANSVCNDLDIGYNCSCIDGYSGDGFKACTDVNECMNSPCHANATCTNTVGSFSCACNNGFAKNSSNPDQCIETDCPGGCGVGADCINATCVCRKGFLPGSKPCSNINECLENLPNGPCGSNTDCEDTIGSYVCSCKSGYEGDPSVGCTKVDICKTTRPCINARCLNQASGYACQCFSGYDIVNDDVCIDIDECTLKKDDCDNSTTNCVNQLGTFNCACKPGFKYGSGFKSCIPENQPATCDPALSSPCPKSEIASCVREGSISVCRCDAGFQKVDEECRVPAGGAEGVQLGLTIEGIGISDPQGSRDNIKAALDNEYKEMQDFQSVIVTKRTPGSILLEYVVRTNNPVDPVEFRRVALFLSDRLNASNYQMGNFQIAPNSEFARSLQDSSTRVLISTLRANPCLGHFCQNGGTCVNALSTGLPTCECAGNFEGEFCQNEKVVEEGLSDGIIAIIVVVVIIAVVLIVTAIVAVVITKKKREKYNTWFSDEAPVVLPPGTYDPGFSRFRRSELFRETEEAEGAYGIYEDASREDA